MENTSEQVRPFETASDLATINDEEKIAAAKTRRKRNYLLRCCGCVTTLVLIVAIVVVILIFTIFKARDPIFRVNKATVEKLQLINGTNTPRPGSNATINVDVSVVNRNYITFKHQYTTSTIYYGGAVIGEVRGPPGTQKARRIQRMNVTVDIIIDRVLSRPNFGSDIKSGLFRMSCYAPVRGKAKIFVINLHATMKMNCTVTFNITSMAILQQKCKLKFKF